MRSKSRNWDVQMGRRTGVILVLCFMFAGLGWSGEPLRRVGTISGTVVDMRPDCSPENCAKLANCKSDEEARQILREIVGGGPADGAVVTVTDDRITRETVTDAEGRYAFTDLPVGPYSASAMIVGADGKSKQSAPRGTETGKTVRLVIYDALVMVRGRITDPDGRPIAGAKITGTLVPMSEVGLPDRRRTVSDANGVYTLTPFEPVNLYRVAGYLNGGSLDAPGALHTQVEIRVEAEGFRQDRVNVPRVLLIAESQLVPGLRLWNALAQCAATAGNGENWKKPKRGLPHTTEEDTITHIDIILTPIPSV